MPKTSRNWSESNKRAVPNKEFQFKINKCACTTIWYTRAHKQDFLIKLKIDISFICMRNILFAWKLDVHKYLYVHIFHGLKLKNFKLSLKLRNPLLIICCTFRSNFDYSSWSQDGLLHNICTLGKSQMIIFHNSLNHILSWLLTQ